MDELGRIGIILGISAYVVVLAWLARKAALDMDERGWPGWIFGILVMFVPPLGLFAWLWFRTPPGSRSPR